MGVVTTLTVLFIVASTYLLLFRSYNQPSIPAYILGGITVGLILDLEPIINQYIFGGALPVLQIQTDLLLGLTQLGIAFLVFTFGLKYDPERLKDAASASINATSASIFLLSLVGFFAGQILGFKTMESAIIASTVALSSSLVGLQLADREIQNDLLHGRLSESIHLLQDVIGLILISVIFASTVSESMYALGATAAFIVVALVFRTKLFDKIAEIAGYSTELLMLAGLTALLVSIGAAQYVGIPMVIGSFAAGLMAAKFPHNMELLDTLGSLKDFFAAILFISLGALVRIPDSKTLLSAFAIMVLSSYLKPAIIYHSLRLKDLDARTSMLTALSLDQVSEISLIIAIQAFVFNLISDQAFQAIILGATASMILSSYTKKHQELIYQKLKPERQVGEVLDIRNHVIIVGHDIQGPRILENLQEENVKVAVIENDPEKVSALKEEGIPAVYGDAVDIETWQKANHEEAALIVSTVPSMEVSRNILKLAEPEDKVLRAENPDEASLLLDEGALHVVVPDLASSELLVDHIQAVINDEEYREELRRKSLLEVRRYLEDR